MGQSQGSPKGSPKGSRSRRWQELPGNYDKLNATRIYPSDNDFGIPFLPKEDRLEAPDFLIPYGTRTQTEEPVPNGAVHFFLDDYRFEPVWGSPAKALAYVQRVGVALTPDFSLYSNYPLALQIYNTYRNRWCGAFWRENGVRIIPSVSWSDERSYAFCFAGLEPGGTVALSTVGLASALASALAGRGTSAGAVSAGAVALFSAGYAEMIRRLLPRTVLVYGERLPEELLEAAGVPDPAPRYGIETRSYPTRWKSIRDARKQAEQSGQQRPADP